MRRRRNVKIVATLGPASTDREMILALFEAGADVFRLNMSHGTHEEIALRYRAIREIEHQTERPIAVLADLQGPKLRVGAFADGGAMLAPGDRFRLDLDPAQGDGTRACLPHP
ncbi:MAG: pyruvate kinase, partial [Pseudomonadota bacterium]